MNLENLKLNIKNIVDNIFKHYPIIFKVIQELKKHNAKVYLVGGAVRDLILNKDILAIPDIDIEVHNLNLEELSVLLNKFGEVDYVGKSFGILKLRHLNIDWSLPRSDKQGRKPEVKIDPYLDIKEALKRRDLTINAIAIDLIKLELVDPFNGVKDIKEKVLRSPDINFFQDDPLRFYRVMQFISRFQMWPNSELNNICQNMNIKDVSIERIDQEFKKLLLKSNIPSLGIRWLQDINRLKDILPELYNTTKVPQDPLWHPEGHVFEHLMQSLDASALLKYKNNEEKLTIMLAALSHDLGKVKTTIKIPDGHIRSPGHDEAGEPLTKSMLKNIITNKHLIKTVSILVKYHMRPMQFIKSNASLSAYKRLAYQLNSFANLDMLIKLLISDLQGRNGKSHFPLNKTMELATQFKEKAIQAKVLLEPEKPILTGKDLINIINPGPLMGQILKYAYKIQINKNIKDKDILKERTFKDLNIKI